LAIIAVLGQGEDPVQFNQLWLAAFMFQYRVVVHDSFFELVIAFRAPAIK
jgi:hypothetical protein